MKYDIWNIYNMIFNLSCRNYFIPFITVKGHNWRIHKAKCSSTGEWPLSWKKMWVAVRKTQTEFPPGPFVLVQVVQAVGDPWPFSKRFPLWKAMGASIFWNGCRWNPRPLGRTLQIHPRVIHKVAVVAITLSSLAISLWNFETSICCVDLSLVPTPVFFSHLKPWF